MSKDFAKLMFDKGLADIKDLKNLVHRNYITKEDFADITKQEVENLKE